MILELLDPITVSCPKPKNNLEVMNIDITVGKGKTRTYRTAAWSLENNFLSLQEHQNGMLETEKTKVFPL